jgi:hypothetical protein
LFPDLRLAAEIVGLAAVALWVLTDGGQSIVDRACGAGAGGPEVPARVALSPIDGKSVHIELPDGRCSRPSKDIRIRDDLLAVLPSRDARL